MNAIPLALSVLVACGGARSEEAAKPWKLTLRPARYAGVFLPDETATLTATVTNVGSDDPHATVAWEVRDVPSGEAKPKTYSPGKVDLEVAKGQAETATLTLGSAKELPLGEYLEVVATLSAGGAVQDQWVKGFGFLPERQPTTPSETSNFGLLAAMQWPFLQRLGARWDRPNWGWEERPMEWAQRHGVRYVALINEANQAFDRRMPMEEYVDFVRQSVSRYKQYVRYWQLGNEFDVYHRNGPKRFVEVQEAGYRAAKAADPTCVVVGGSITDLQVRYDAWDECLTAGLSRWCDVYDFHFYAPLDVTQKTLDVIREAMRKHGADKPLWCTETAGIPVTAGTERNKAGYVLKRFAQLLGNGVQVVFWHVLEWPHVEGEAGKIEVTALVDWDGFAKLSVFTYTAMTRELEGARFVKRWDCGEGVYAFEFARDGRAKVVLWSETQPRSLTLDCAAGEAGRTGVTGRRESLRVPGPVAAEADPAILDLPGPVKSLRG